MKIYIARKSISDLKHPVVRREYRTDAVTVEGFIREMVAKNYEAKPVKDSLADCQALALSEFENGGYYIVNVAKDIRYAALNEALRLDEGDELVLIKLKYVRGMIW